MSLIQPKSKEITFWSFSACFRSHCCCFCCLSFNSCPPHPQTWPEIQKKRFDEGVMETLKVATDVPLDPVNFNSLISNSSLFRTRTTSPGFFEHPLFRTVFRFPWSWEFEIEGFNYLLVSDQNERKENFYTTWFSILVSAPWLQFGITLPPLPPFPSFFPNWVHSAVSLLHVRSHPPAPYLASPTETI